MEVLDPPPPGFGRCRHCPHGWHASPQRPDCWSCAATGLADPWRALAHCWVCDHPLPPAQACRIRAPVCLNHWCRREDRGFDTVWAIGPHTGMLRQVIARYKYRGGTGWARVLGAIVAGYLLDHAPEFEDIDLIVAAPASSGSLHPNHGVGPVLAAAASVVGELWRFEDLHQTCIVKERPTRPLSSASSVSTRRRWAASELRHTLRIRDAAIVRGRRLLVLDDVFTDGSTLREIALALQNAGAIAVSGLVLARQPWQDLVRQS